MALPNYESLRINRKPRDFVLWNGELHEVKEREGVHCSTHCGLYARGETITDRQRRDSKQAFCTSCHKGSDVVGETRLERRSTPLALSLGKLTSDMRRLDRSSKRRKS